MEIKEKFPLVSHNTFGIEATADWWVSYHSLDDLDRLARDEYFRSLPYLAIGEGSNLLFLNDYHGAILYSEIKDREVLPTPKGEDQDTVLLRIGSGIIWDEFVAWSLEQGYYGAENLSWIPGSVGAAAVQNIGAYGSEVAQLIYQVETFDLKTRSKRVFFPKECLYDYRYSYFKEKEAERYIITHVVFALSRKANVNLSYKALHDYLPSGNVTPRDVRKAVIEIRQAKLPDPKVLPNAGSFFMNPIVSSEVYQELQEKYPDMLHYPASQGVKLSAAWLLDNAGLKGYRVGNVGTYERQPLILVNRGGAKGTDVAQFASLLVEKVKAAFGVTLHPEVRYIGAPTRS